MKIVVIKKLQWDSTGQHTIRCPHCKVSMAIRFNHPNNHLLSAGKSIEWRCLGLGWRCCERTFALRMQKPIDKLAHLYASNAKCLATKRK